MTDARKRAAHLFEGCSNVTINGKPIEGVKSVSIEFTEFAATEVCADCGMELDPQYKGHACLPYAQNKRAAHTDGMMCGKGSYDDCACPCGADEVNTYIERLEAVVARARIIGNPRDDTQMFTLRIQMMELANAIAALDEAGK